MNAPQFLWMPLSDQTSPTLDPDEQGVFTPTRVASIWRRNGRLLWPNGKTSKHLKQVQSSLATQAVRHITWFWTKFNRYYAPPAPWCAYHTRAVWKNGLAFAFPNGPVPLVVLNVPDPHLNTAHDRLAFLASLPDEATQGATVQLPLLPIDTPNPRI